MLCLRAGGGGGQAAQAPARSRGRGAGAESPGSPTRTQSHDTLTWDFGPRGRGRIDSWGLESTGLRRFGEAGLAN